MSYMSKNCEFKYLLIYRMRTKLHYIYCRDTHDLNLARLNANKLPHIVLWFENGVITEFSETE